MMGDADDVTYAGLNAPILGGFNDLKGPDPID